MASSPAGAMMTRARPRRRPECLPRSLRLIRLLAGEDRRLRCLLGRRIQLAGAAEPQVGLTSKARSTPVVAATTPWCAFNEVHPLEFQSQVPAAGVLIEARLMPAVEGPPQRRSLADRFFRDCGTVLQVQNWPDARPGDHREIGLGEDGRHRPAGVPGQSPSSPGTDS